LPSLSQLRMHLLAGAVALTLLCPLILRAQETDDDAPLGDVARNLRRHSSSSQDVIDNDNLVQVMDDAASRRPERTSWLYSILHGGKSFEVSAPDVTCSLSFNGKAKSLISSQYVQQDLPASEMLKLEGPAAIEGDSLAISVFNGTEWHLSEVAVAFTIVKKPEPPDMALYFGPAKLSTASSDSTTENTNPDQKQSDVTVLYRMRAAAAPSAVTVFRAPLNLQLAPGEEWHWAIVQAKGYPPTGTEQASQRPPATPIVDGPVPPATTAQPAGMPGPNQQ